MAVSQDGTQAYVINASDGTISVISTATATIPVGNLPDGVAVSPDGTLAYVINAGDGTVSVISTATSTVTATIPVGNFPAGVAVTPDGTLAYIVMRLRRCTCLGDQYRHPRSGLPPPTGVITPLAADPAAARHPDLITLTLPTSPQRNYQRKHSKFQDQRPRSRGAGDSSWRVKSPGLSRWVTTISTPPRSRVRSRARSSAVAPHTR